MMMIPSFLTLLLLWFDSLCSLSRSVSAWVPLRGLWVLTPTSKLRPLLLSHISTRPCSRVAGSWLDPPPASLRVRVKDDAHKLPPIPHTHAHAGRRRGAFVEGCRRRLSLSLCDSLRLHVSRCLLQPLFQPSIPPQPAEQTGCKLRSAQGPGTTSLDRVFRLA